MQVGANVRSAGSSYKRSPRDIKATVGNSAAAIFEGRRERQDREFAGAKRTPEKLQRVPTGRRRIAPSSFFIVASGDETTTQKNALRARKEPMKNSTLAVLLILSTTSASFGQVLYDNGPVASSFGTGVDGADESVLQTLSLSMGTTGFGVNPDLPARIADDFTVPAGETWDISRLTLFAYQTGSGNTSTIHTVNLQIWDGDPSDPMSQVVFGDTTTNRIESTGFTNIYRVTEADTGTGSQRPIMSNTAIVGVTLSEGTYWLDWQIDGSAPSGPWAPPIAIAGETTTGNGQQNYSDAWLVATDGGTLTPQGFPFIVEEPSCSAVPQCGLDRAGAVGVSHLSENCTIRPPTYLRRLDGDPSNAVVARS